MQAELSYQRVREGFEALKMSAALEALDNVLEVARVEELPVIEIVDRLLEIELSARHDRRVETNLKFAGLPYRQSLDEFDFEAQPSIDPQLVARLATLRFLEDGTNVLLLGAPGVGKTALAVGLGLRALEAGYRISFLACHDLVIRHRRATRRWSGRWRCSCSRWSPSATSARSRSSSPRTRAGERGGRSCPTK